MGIVKCENCGKVFRRHSRLIGIGFCTRKCSVDYHKTRKVVPKTYDMRCLRRIKALSKLECDINE
jgi:hypothetical protein